HRPNVPAPPEAADLLSTLPPGEKDRCEQGFLAGTWSTVTKSDGGGSNWQSGQPVHAHSLSVSSYDSQLERVEQTRIKGLHGVRVAWIGLLIFLCYLGYVGLWVIVRPRRAMVLMHGVCILLFFLLRLPESWWGDELSERSRGFRLGVDVIGGT